MNDAAASPLPGTRAANPLLDFSDLPRFGDFTPDAITPAVEVLLADARAAIADATLPQTPLLMKTSGNA